MSVQPRQSWVRHQAEETRELLRLCHAPYLLGQQHIAGFLERKQIRHLEEPKFDIKKATASVSDSLNAGSR